MEEEDIAELRKTKEAEWQTYQEFNEVSPNVPNPKVSKVPKNLERPINGNPETIFFFFFWNPNSFYNFYL